MKSPLDIANLMSKAAHAKAQKPSKANPDPDHDGDNDLVPALDTDKDKGKKPLSGKQKGAIAAKNKGAMK